MAYLIEYGSDDDETDENNNNIVQLILNQTRWLHYILKEKTNICKYFLQTLEVLYGGPYDYASRPVPIR